MSVFIASLNSGSNGNCYYVGNEQEAVLVDAGISCREVEKRMRSIGLAMQKVKAIFISHEHTDHIRGLSILSKKYQLPVYITPDTLRDGRLFVEKHLIRSFREYERIAVGELTILPFPKHHDAADPYSFTISCREIKVGVFTDIGLPCAHLVSQFQQCHAAFLEANYDEEMLENGGYPYYLKKRIRGGKGHLSNHQALQLFSTHRPSFMSHLVLSHLSKNNNCPQLVNDLFTQHAQGVQIVVASRFEPTSVYTIHHPQQPLAPPAAAIAEQMELAFG
jgi:phosphoribosyl 1,2-cyclic phosphodiesterase